MTEYKWHEVYKAALLETDWSKMEERLKETLIKCSFSTRSIDKVAPDEISKQAKDTGDDDGVRAIYEEDAAGDILGRDGASGAVGKVVRLDRAALSEARQRTTAERTGKDAADLFSAAVV